MKALARLKARLAARTNLEHEQALLRLVIAGVAFAFLALFGAPVEVKSVLAGYFAGAIGIFAAFCVWPATNVWLRIVRMILDAGAVTFFVWLSGAAGVLMIGVYLFLIFGNGFRFGRRYLYLCRRFVGRVSSRR